MESIFDFRFVTHHCEFPIYLREVVELEQRNSDMSVSDEEKLFRKVSLYLESTKRSIGLFTIEKLAFTPSSISAARLKGIARIICNKVFQPIMYTNEQILKFSHFFICFAYLEATTTKGEVVTFEHVFINTFLAKLSHRFTSKKQSPSSKTDRKESKKGTEKKTEKQTKLENKNSVRFLGNACKVYSKLFYKVLEFLLRNYGKETVSYLLLLLKLEPAWDKESGLMCAVVDVGKMVIGNSPLADEFKSRYIPKVISQLELLKDVKEVTSLAEDILKDHEDLKKSLIQFINCFHPQHLIPQDFIKISLAATFRSIPRYGPDSKNDFEIDEEESNPRPVKLSSLNFLSHKIFQLSSFNSSSYEWQGLKVHLLS